MIFSTYEMKYFWYLLKKSKFSFYFFSLRELTETNRIKTNFFPSYFSLIPLGSVRLLGIILCLHLESGLKCHLNEGIRRMLQFKKAA